jgi:hypothetical protein
VLCIPGGAAAAAAASTPARAVVQSKVAAREVAVTGLSGSGGAVRVPAPKQTGGAGTVGLDIHRLCYVDYSYSCNFCN